MELPKECQEQSPLEEENNAEKYFQIQKNHILLGKWQKCIKAKAKAKFSERAVANKKISSVGSIVLLFSPSIYSSIQQIFWSAFSVPGTVLERCFKSTEGWHGQLEKDPAMQRTREGAFQAKGTARAKALRWRQEGGWCGQSVGGRCTDPSHLGSVIQGSDGLLRDQRVPQWDGSDLCYSWENG